MYRWRSTWTSVSAPKISATIRDAIFSQHAFLSKKQLYENDEKCTCSVSARWKHGSKSSIELGCNFIPCTIEFLGLRDHLSLGDRMENFLGAGPRLWPRPPPLPRSPPSSRHRGRCSELEELDEQVWTVLLAFIRRLFGTESAMNKNTLVCILKLTKLFSHVDSILGNPLSSFGMGGLRRTVLECNARKLQHFKLDSIQIDQELRRRIDQCDSEIENSPRWLR